MKKIIGCILISIFCLHASWINAKAVRETTLEEACEKSPIIIVAKVVKHQYESILNGETISVGRFSLWQEFKIINILKNINNLESIALSQIIRVPNKSNSCIRYVIFPRKSGHLEERMVA